MCEGKVAFAILASGGNGGVGRRGGEGGKEWGKGGR